MIYNLEQREYNFSSILDPAFGFQLFEMGEK